MNSLIAPDQHFAVWAALLAIAGFGFWCERFPIGRRYTGVMLLITLAIVLSNLRIIPTAAPAYDAVWDYLVPLAIPLLLFQADLRRIFREAGQTLLAFCLGGVGVVLGVVLATTVIDLGSAEAELAGVFTGTYVGGSLNFAAVAEATDFQDGSALTAAVAADNVVTNLHLLLIVFLPGVAWLARRYAPREVAADQAAAPPEHRVAELDVAGLLFALALAFGLAFAGKLVAGLFERPQYAILVTTALAVLLATFARPVVQRLSGHTEAGNALMFVFLATIGASADIWLLVEAAPVLFLFAIIIVATHLLLLFTVGWVLRIGLAELCIASAVCIGGPASAPAIASARGWHDLVLPGVLAGSFGYALGSFVGITVFELLG